MSVQKTEEPKKLPETDQTVAKILVWFRFHFLKTEIFSFSFGFGAGFFHLETDRTDQCIYVCTLLAVWLADHKFEHSHGMLVFHYLIF